MWVIRIESAPAAPYAAEIFNVIRSKADTPFYRSVSQTTLVEIRKKIEKHIKDSYFRQVQAPIGVKATLKAWMERMNV